MLILDAHISDVHRARDFGRIEARVNFVAKVATGQPVRRLSVTTNVPARGATPLRDRLLRDAALLARTLPHRTNHSAPAATA